MSHALTGYRTPSALGRYSDPEDYLSPGDERTIGNLDRELGFLNGIRNRIEFMRRGCDGAAMDRLQEMIDLLDDAKLSGQGAISEIEAQAKERYENAEEAEADQQYDLWAEGSW